MTHNPSDGQARRSAVALKYREGDVAPRVVAKGYGEIAETIIRHAQQAGLYVHEQPDLVGLLVQLELDQAIPPELYQAIAELLAWVYQVEHDIGPEISFK